MAAVGLSDAQQLDDSGLLSNSSEPLSTPPGSPDLAASLLPTPPNANVNSRHNAFSGVASAHPTTTSASTSTSAASVSAPAPKKPGRKKKILTPEEEAAKAAKEPKKPGRKPRVPKDPNAPPVQRKRKIAEPEQSQPPLARQPKITDLVGTIHVGLPPVSSPTTNMRPQQPSLGHVPTTPGPRPASSGQLFDPVRGSVQVDPPPVSPKPQLPLNRASASPSIKSLIDGPPPTSQPSRLSTMSSSSLLKPDLSSYPATQATPMSRTASGSTPLPPYSHQTEMEVDQKPKKTETASGPSSNAPTPPPKQRSKEAIPLPTGSGLLSGTPFGLTAASNGGPPNGTSGTSGTNIWLSFSLKGQTNVTINFAREVERKYGFAALHPRLAARNERRRLMAAAGAELEKAAGMGSNDDMSADPSEPDSDVEMEGINDVPSTTTAPEPGKRRKRKAEDYDRNDDFIDDTEMAWEEQALMAKDGFFVYSGPLITEGERPAVERADGTVKRGRGRGRGGSTRGETSGRGSRGGGRGSRGGTTVRKPRVTKADRAMMEQEKLEREKMAATLVAKPASYPAGAV